MNPQLKIDIPVSSVETQPLRSIGMTVLTIASLVGPNAPVQAPPIVQYIPSPDLPGPSSWES